MQLTFENKTIDQLAIELLQAYENTRETYYGGFSGGIDSQIIYNLAVRAEVRVEWHYNESPIDPPEIRDFIKIKYPDVIFSNHSKGFFNKHFMSHGFPLRNARWCCRIIKECGGVGRVKILGMRREESKGRSRYKCFMENPGGGHWLLPIINWTNADRWQYLSEQGIKPNPLYALGFNRTGCVLCPFQSKYDIELSMKYFPKTVNLWKLAAEKYIQKRIERGTPMTFKNGEEYFNWWITR
ncbi:MAG: phosphoadenosine phosphosulfate reductase family protein [Dehalococcoidales bacterium]|nr:phosphoadenosine phosphosulfate reductase family protein [Dehalococcoidales bacterium]